MSSSNVLSDKDVNNSLKNLSGAGAGATKADVKSMEYHRQVLKSKMEEEKYGHHTTTNIPTAAVGAPSIGLGTTTVAAAAARPSLASSTQRFIRRTLAGLPADPNASGHCSSAHQYVSPSDDIMSPCTAKLNALKGRQAGKAKPKSLFAQASAKRFVGENVLGARNASLTTSSNNNNNNNNDNPRTD